MEKNERPVPTNDPGKPDPASEEVKAFWWPRFLKAEDVKPTPDPTLIPLFPDRVDDYEHHKLQIQLQEDVETTTNPTMLQILYARELGKESTLPSKVVYLKNPQAFMVKEKKANDWNSFSYADAEYLGLSPDGSYLFAAHRTVSTGPTEAPITMIDGDSDNETNDTETIPARRGPTPRKVRDMTIFFVTAQYLQPVVTIDIDTTVTHWDLTDDWITFVKFQDGDASRALVIKLLTEEHVWRSEVYHDGTRAIAVPIHFFHLREKFFIRCVTPLVVAQARVSGFLALAEPQFVVVDDGFLVNRTNVITYIRRFKNPKEPIVVNKLSSQSGMRAWKILAEAEVVKPLEPLSPDSSINDCFVLNLEVCHFTDQEDFTPLFHTPNQPTYSRKTRLQQINPEELENPCAESSYLVEMCLDVEKCINNFAALKIASLEGREAKLARFYQYDTYLVGASTTGTRIHVTALIEISRARENAFAIFTFYIKWLPSGMSCCMKVDAQYISSDQAMDGAIVARLIQQKAEKSQKYVPKSEHLAHQSFRSQPPWNVFTPTMQANGFSFLGRITEIPYRAY